LPPAPSPSRRKEKGGGECRIRSEGRVGRREVIGQRENSITREAGREVSDARMTGIVFPRPGKAGNGLPEPKRFPAGPAGPAGGPRLKPSGG
jgi:hypothetical protein